MQRNKGFVFLWAVFFLYFFCYATMEMDLWVFLLIWSSGLAIYILVKTKLPSKKRIFVSAILAILASIAYLGIQMNIKVVLRYGIRAGIPTMLCSLAFFSIAETNRAETNSGMKMISTDGKYAPFASIAIAIIVGGILSVVNYFLMTGSNTVDFEISISRLLICLNPAIFEEIVCRTIFMVFGLYAVGGEKTTRFQSFTIWFMMCVPHTIAHGYDMVSTILLCILFGLPFAILQRKRDVASAMVSHGLVDAIRFTIFGLGM